MLSFKTAVYNVFFFFSPLLFLFEIAPDWMGAVHAHYHVCHIFSRLPGFVPQATRAPFPAARVVASTAVYTTRVLIGHRETKNHVRLTVVRHGARVYNAVWPISNVCAQANLCTFEWERRRVVMVLRSLILLFTSPSPGPSGCESHTGE